MTSNIPNGREIPKKGNKPKKKTTAKLRKELWAVFTKYIKERDKWTCFTCDRRAMGQGMGGGHYKPKGACGADAYFSEINVNAQCTFCNLTLQGNQVEYRKRLVTKWGEGAIATLDKNFRTLNKYFPYEKSITYYKEQIKKLTCKN